MYLEREVGEGFHDELSSCSTLALVCRHLQSAAKSHSPSCAPARRSPIGARSWPGPPPLRFTDRACASLLLPGQRRHLQPTAKLWSTGPSAVHRPGKAAIHNPLFRDPTRSLATHPSSAFAAPRLETPTTLPLECRRGWPHLAHNDNLMEFAREATAACPSITTTADHRCRLQSTPGF
jgi:hypothetical protein